MALTAANIRHVNSSDCVAIIQDVGRSRPTTRTCRASSSLRSRFQSASDRRLSRSTCSTSKTSPGRESTSSRNSSGRASLAPDSFSTYQPAIRRPRSAARSKGASQREGALHTDFTCTQVKPATVAAGTSRPTSGRQVEAPFASRQSVQ